jgi:hypothetical protein
MPTVKGSQEEYALYCSCRKGAVAMLCKWSEVKSCEVVNAAYHRGYGTPEEIVPIDDGPREAWTIDVSKYLGVMGGDGRSEAGPMERRRSSR